MRFLYRWAANGLAFYLGLYLVDTLIAPWFYIRRGWIAIVLAVLMSCVNSMIRPFPRFKTRRKRSFGFFGLTALGNYLFMQIIVLLGSALTGNPFGVLLAAIFLTLLAALMNHLIGFKPKEGPDIPTRDQGLDSTGTARQVRETDLRGAKTTSKRKKRRQRKKQRRQTRT